MYKGLFFASNILPEVTYTGFEESPIKGKAVFIIPYPQLMLPGSMPRILISNDCLRLFFSWCFK